MTGITATEARSNLYRLIDETAESHKPIVIMGKRNKAVLVSEEDWSAIQETLYLLSVPGMRESIREGMETPVDECDEELDWLHGSWFTSSKPRKMQRSWPPAASSQKPKNYWS